MILVSSITLFACEGNYNKVQQMSISDNEPTAVGVDINMKYTDSGKVVSNLLSPRLLDYSIVDFPYVEFPEGIELTQWEDNGDKVIVVADYAIQYEKSNLIDLRDNVVITRSDGKKLYAEQLYWDRLKKWVFTDRPYKIQFEDGSFNDGSGFDGSEDFKNFMSWKNQGVQLIDRKTKETF